MSKTKHAEGFLGRCAPRQPQCEQAFEQHGDFLKRHVGRVLAGNGLLVYRSGNATEVYVVALRQGSLPKGAAEPDCVSVHSTPQWCPLGSDDLLFRTPLRRVESPARLGLDSNLKRYSKFLGTSPSCREHQRVAHIKNLSCSRKPAFMQGASIYEP